jgi:hypothetical protein
MFHDRIVLLDTIDCCHRVQRYAAMGSMSVSRGWLANKIESAAKECLPKANFRWSTIRPQHCLHSEIPVLVYRRGALQNPEAKPMSNETNNVTEIECMVI